MAVRKINGRFVIEFEQSGSRVFRRLPAAATKAQAVALETRIRQSLIDQKLLGKVPDVSLERAIGAWLEEASARKSAKKTGQHALCVKNELAGDYAIGDMARCGEAIQRSGKGRNLSNGTINRRLCILKAVAKFAWRKGWTEENLSAKIQLLPEKKYQRREVTPDMARLLIEKASTPRAKALIAFSAYTGMRLGEVLKLKPENIKGDVLVLRDTKNGMDRIVPILPGLKPHLGQIPFGANWRNVYRGFESARKRAKLDIRYHDLRHMVGTALHEAGADQRRIMDILGHKSIQTSARYIHPSQEANRKALEAALGDLAKKPRRKMGKKAA